MIDKVIDRGLKRLRFKEFLHRHLEDSQDRLCEHMNYATLYNKKSSKNAKFYQNELEFYGLAYKEFESKRKKDFEKDLSDFKLEQQREIIQIQIEKSWSNYKQKRKSVFDDIYFYHEAKELVNQLRS